MDHFERQTDNNFISGSCNLFACRCCRTKFGWWHQAWCDIAGVTDPECGDCAYYNFKRERCAHPAKRMNWRDAG